MHIGLSNAQGRAWFDGVQLVNAGNWNSSEGYTLSDFNSVENSSFEHYTYAMFENWTSVGGNKHLNTGDYWGGAHSVEMELEDSGTVSLYQDVPVHSRELLTFSGMIKTIGVNGTGAYFKLEYLNSVSQVVYGATLQTACLTGTKDWIRLTSLADAPAEAVKVRITCVFDGSGIVHLDDIKLVPRRSEKYSYNNAKNYILNVEDSLKHLTGQAYNENIGTASTFTDALNNTTNYDYDNLNRLNDVAEPLTNHAYYGYDAVSNLTATRDQRSSSPTDNNYRTTYEYNKLNQLETLKDPLGRSTSYTYDRSGNLTLVSQSNGKAVEFEYDSANRLTKKTLQDGSGKCFNYIYDNADNLRRITDQDNYTIRSWNYDLAGRLEYSSHYGHHLYYDWDKSNNLLSISGIGLTGDIEYEYGRDNRLTSITLPSIEQPDGNYMFYDYDDSGRIFNIEYPGYNSETHISYDPNGWCTKIADPEFPGSYIFDYVYYNNGNIHYIGSWAGFESFQYYPNNRLSSWSFIPNNYSGIPAKNETYTYDAAGNLLTKGDQTFNYYNSANQLNDEDYLYDNNGNLTSDGHFNYCYNAENQLIEVRYAFDNSLFASYSYDQNGLRKSKNINGQVTNFIWDDFGNLVREQFGTIQNEYYYDTNGKIISFVKNNLDNNNTYYYHSNLRGDIVSVTDYNGDIQGQYHYDPWGNHISDTGVLYQPFRYAGYYYDFETGLYYCQSRYYSPVLGRFLTKDPISYIKHEDPQTLNLYTYCRNNPVNNVDPTGTKDYVIYYYNQLSTRNFNEQAWNSPYYASSDDVQMMSAGTVQEFIDAWNSIGDDAVNVYLYVHGAQGTLFFADGNLSFSGDNSFNNLSSKNVSGVVGLFSCDGGAGNEGNNVAWMFAGLTGANVRACEGHVSYTKLFGKYHARSSWDGFGIWKTYYYSEGRAMNTIW